MARKKTKQQPVSSLTISPITTSTDQGEPTGPIPTSPASFSTTSAEEIPTPYPHPGRAVFGFALHIVGICLFFVYCVWLWVPTPILNQLGITYVPAKLWAVTVPLLILSSLFIGFLGVFIRNYVVLNGVFDDIREVVDDFKDD